VLRRIFGPKRKEERSWRKMRYDKLNSLYSSMNIVKVIKSIRMMWAGHVARMGEGRGRERWFIEFQLGGQKVRDHWEDIGVGGRLILSWTLQR